MIGTIIGDMVCSCIKPGGRLPENRGLFDGDCRITANTVMFLAVGKSLMECAGDYGDLLEKVRENSKTLMEAVFGEKAKDMPFSRIACSMPMAYFAKNYKDVRFLTSKVLSAIPGSTIEEAYAAELETAEVFKYLNCLSAKSFKKAFVPRRYIFTDEMGKYLSEFNHSFRETLSFEDAIRKASATSDPCNMAAIVGGFAEPYHGVPESFREKALEIMGPGLGNLFEEIERSALPKLSTYIPDSTKPAEVHFMPARFTPIRREYSRKKREEKRHGQV